MTLCGTTAEFCADPSAVTITGDPSWSPTNQALSGDSCQATLSSEPSAWVGSVEAALTGPIQVVCSPGDTRGQFDCTRTGASTAESFSVVGTTTREGCVAAAEPCPALVPPDLGVGP